MIALFLMSLFVIVGLLLFSVSDLLERVATLERRVSASPEGKEI